VKGLNTMNIFDKLAKAFGPKAKAPSVHELERLLEEAEAAVIAADSRLKELEAGRVDAVTAGEESRAKHRSDLLAGRDDADDARAAVAAIRARLSDAQAAAIEKGRREQYDRARAAQQAAADAVSARYEQAAEVLRDLARQAAEADELAAAANRNLPVATKPLLAEAEGLCRDWPAEPEQVLSRETVKLWCSEDGQPVPDQDRVRPLGGDRGLLDIESWRTSRGMPVTRMTFEKITTRKWRAPAYAARLKDLDLPPLQPEKPAPGDVEVSFAPIAPAAAEPPTAAE